MTATEHIVLVDENDNLIGTAEKMQAHEQGLCHRAFSVFIYRQRVTVEILLQQRAFDKYHSGGLWTNTCCSHPFPGEEVVSAGERRLLEEMGIKTGLQSIGKFHYVAHFENGLVENEVDHVLIGTLADEDFKPNPGEVAAWRWVGLDELGREMARNPEKFTPWLAQALGLVSHFFG